ncbi:response regulators consisting of a CheY-like receiver domain and a winged-helix DNA-binding domain [Longilinea arvoryzae]|uniref:Transcriptional regulatory protein KdpE n=1 Tax=Longilinea arvoryzae TaxID=360412 RepID=A0A0S7B7Z8_9CHLR|nr:response regulator transcription factor [Longilinea arvoryzae]GAP13294.1 response regulators consisting of a CheY-like receiver domain and a winged-helix DNA-binding domain [Longilinea arvoryzae]
MDGNNPVAAQEISAHILLIDDERAIRRMLRVALSAHGYQVYEAASGEEGLQSAASQHPDVIILDLGLPDLDGVEVTRRLREWTQTPIIILSVRGGEEDKIAALDAGADDYLTKPFGTGELTARIRTALRHAQPSGDAQPIFQLAGLRVDLLRRTVTVDNKGVELTPTEYEILKLMVQHAGKVVTHNQLLRAVWGTGYEDEAHLLRVNISNLRHKIESDPAQPRYILTESGVGYRLKTG